MANPFSLAAIGLGSSGGGTLLSALGAGITGISTANMYGYQSGIASLNAKIAAQNADYAVSQGETQAAESGMKTAAQIGTTRAKQGASGIAVSSGSPTDVITSERKIGGIDQALIRNNAARVAYGYKTQEMTSNLQASAYGAAQRNTMLATPLNVAGSLISGSASVASKWYQGQSVGLGAPQPQQAPLDWYPE